MQTSTGRKVKAPYQTIGPKREMVTYTKASYRHVDPKDKTSERKLFQEQVTEEMDTWLVRFAMGHSTRFCGERGKQELIRMGYDKKPRLIDLETGDVVDIGGDPYDLSSAAPDETVVIDDN